MQQKIFAALELLLIILKMVIPLTMAWWMFLFFYGYGWQDSFAYLLVRVLWNALLTTWGLR